MRKSRCIGLAAASVMAASVLCLGAAPDPGGATRLTAAPSIDRSVSQLKGSDTGPADFFGDSVAVSGPTAVVGAADHGDDTGRAYVFTRTTAGWGQAAEVYGINTRANDNFGWSVAIWGTTVVIGAPFRAKDAGRAYVFAETALGWQEVARLQGTDTVVNDDFGDSLAVSGDSVVVGASGHADYAGRAYVFTEIADRWREKAELGGGAVAGDEFGWSVAISGTTAVVGAQGCADDAGRAYVFTRRAGYWELAAELKGSDTAAGDFFGASVAVSRTTVVVGAWGRRRAPGRGRRAPTSGRRRRVRYRRHKGADARRREG